MKTLLTRVGFAAVASLTVTACDQAPTQAELSPTFAKAGATTVVTTLAEWQDAILSAKRGATIAIEGTIEIPDGEERFLEAPDVTITAASPGSGLRGAGGGSFATNPRCLVCLGTKANGATVTGLTVDGAVLFEMEARAKGVTFQDNHVVCEASNGCFIQFFVLAPDALVADNVLMGEPIFSSIQIQASTGSVVRDNWIEHGGGSCGIRVVQESDRVLVADNTIASAPRRAICVLRPADRGTFRDNTILEITLAGAPSCLDATLGKGTAGTANTWENNDAPVVSDPVGICGPS